MDEINFFSENIENPIVDKEQEVEKYIRHLLKNEGKELGSINYIFCNDEQILEINNTYLSHAYYTDIISFDNTEGNIINGDIYISIDTVRNNSEEYKVSFNNELHRVIFHGVLHFCGYNDLSEEEELEMREKEDYYLNYNKL